MMTTARPPKEVALRWKTIVAGIIVGLIRGLCIGLAVISGIIVVFRYMDIVGGNLPTDIQKITLDYSMSVFAGTAAFLLLYRYKFEDIIYDLFEVKKIKSIINE